MKATFTMRTALTTTQYNGENLADAVRWVRYRLSGMTIVGNEITTREIEFTNDKNRVVAVLTW